jgi:hypothetical protein
MAGVGNLGSWPGVALFLGVALAGWGSGMAWDGCELVFKVVDGLICLAARSLRPHGYRHRWCYFRVP